MNRTDDMDSFIDNNYQTHSDEIDDRAVIEMMHNADRQFEALGTMITRLTAIKDTISAYGISRPMMEACDPRGELVQRGLIGAYEDLSVTPEKGDVADAAVEGIADTIKYVLYKMFGMFKEAGKRMQDYKDTQNKLLYEYHEEIDALVEIFNKLKSFDEPSFDAKSIYAYNPKDYAIVAESNSAILDVVYDDRTMTLIKKIVASLDNVSLDKDALEKMRKDSLKPYYALSNNTRITNSLGLSIDTHYKYNIRIETVKPTVLSERKNIKEHGWKLADVKKCIARSLSAGKRMKASVEFDKKINIIIDDLIDDLNKKVRRGALTDSLTYYNYHMAIKLVWYIINLNTKLEVCGYRADKHLLTTDIQLIKSAIASAHHAPSK